MNYTMTELPSTLNELYKEWTGKDYSDEFIPCNTYYIVARDEEKVVGAITLVIHNDPFFQRHWGLIENVFVSEGYRNNGVAKEMMERAEMQASMFGCKYVKLTSRKPEGIALYRSLGYEEGSSFRKEL